MGNNVALRAQSAVSEDKEYTKYDTKILRKATSVDSIQLFRRHQAWAAVSCNSSIIIQYDNCYSLSVRYFDIQTVVRTMIQQQWSGMVWVGSGRAMNLNQF